MPVILGSWPLPPPSKPATKGWVLLALYPSDFLRLLLLPFFKKDYVYLFERVHERECVSRGQGELDSMVSREPDARAQS